MRIDFNALRDIYNELLADVESAKKLDTEVNTESFIKRMYVRAFFAMIEGIIFQLKQIALEANNEAGILEAYEIELLRERSGEIRDNGKAVERKAKLKFLPNLQFAFLAVDHVLALDFRIGKGSGWEALKLSVDIRGRLTHPKTKSNVMISGSDMHILGQANARFRDEVVRLIEKIRNCHCVV